MNRKISRVFASLVLAFGFALLSPNLAAACSCSGCTGTYCWCECNFCSDAWPPMYPCLNTLSYNATQEELDAFKSRIDLWSPREELRAVVEAANEIYSSVLFQDRQGYIEASEKFQQAVNFLSDDARKGLALLGQKPRQK